MNYKHGLTSSKKPSRFYNIWKGIKNRTRNPNSVGYRTYGAKGIKCEWTTFNKFRIDMYKSYLLHSEKFGEANTTIERKNNKGNYCKENCRWATWEEQLKNRKCINRFMIK